MTPSAWAGLLLDATLTGPNPDPARTAAVHAEHRQAPWAELLGPLVVPDTLLSGVNRAVADLGIGPVPVCVVNSSGAGGLVALAEREFSDLEVVAVHAELRDLDDLSGNVARVAAAGRTFTTSDREVHVGLPAAPGWQSAAESVEIEGMVAALSASDQLRTQMSDLVELDCPFLVTDPGQSPAELAAVVLALVDGGEPSTELPADADAVRVRRRLRGVWTADPEAAGRRLLSGT